MRTLPTHQQPPGASLLSNTRMTSNAFSFANASMVMAPPGPKPITATRFTGAMVSNTRREAGVECDVRSCSGKRLCFVPSPCHGLVGELLGDLFGNGADTAQSVRLLHARTVHTSWCSRISAMHCAIRLAPAQHHHFSLANDKHVVTNPLRVYGAFGTRMARSLLTSASRSAWAQVIKDADPRAWPWV